MVNQILDRRTVAIPGGQGVTGDVTPALLAARNEAVAARGDAIAARDQAEAFASGAVALQDVAIAEVLGTEDSLARGVLASTLGPEAILNPESDQSNAVQTLIDNSLSAYSPQ